MFKIRISELELFYRVGVSEEERADPQRLLVSVEMDVAAEEAAGTDDIRNTIDYFQVSQQLLAFGEGRTWKLLERLSEEIAGMINDRFGPQKVSVEVKKFVIPEARYVSVTCVRTRQAGG